MQGQRRGGKRHKRQEKVRTEEAGITVEMKKWSRERPSFKSGQKVNENNCLGGGKFLVKKLAAAAVPWRR